jgi:hypothetical protein
MFSNTKIGTACNAAFFTFREILFPYAGQLLSANALQDSMQFASSSAAGALWRRKPQRDLAELMSEKGLLVLKMIK